VASATLRVSVGLCVRAVKGKRLELSPSNVVYIVDIQRLTVARGNVTACNDSEVKRSKVTTTQVGSRCTRSLRTRRIANFDYVSTFSHVQYKENLILRSPCASTVGMHVDRTAEVILVCCDAVLLCFICVD